MAISLPPFSPTSSSAICARHACNWPRASTTTCTTPPMPCTTRAGNCSPGVRRSRRI